jgi:hypothetical protein
MDINCEKEDLKISNKLLHVFEYVYYKHISYIFAQDLEQIFRAFIRRDVEMLYERKRRIPMASYNDFTYKVNDYQFVLRSEPNFRYVVHTNFLIENCGKDKWSRYLDDRNVSVQFYKVPISVDINDLWIDDHDIPKYTKDRRRDLTNSIRIFRRIGYTDDRNDINRDVDYEINDFYREMDDNDRSDYLYRRTLDFPDVPDSSLKLEPLLMTYPNLKLKFGKQKIVQGVREYLTKLDPYHRI